MCGKRVRLWKIPVRSVKSLAKLGDLIKLPFNTERLNKLTETYLVSNEKLLKELEIGNLPMEAKEGLKKTIEYFNN